MCYAKCDHIGVSSDETNFESKSNWSDTPNTCLCSPIEEGATNNNNNNNK